MMMTEIPFDLLSVALVVGLAGAGMSWLVMRGRVRVTSLELGEATEKNRALNEALERLQRSLEETQREWQEARLSLREVEAYLVAAKERQSDLAERLAGEQGKVNESRKRYESLIAAHTELRTALEEREASHARQIEQFEEQKQALGEQFKGLANDILEMKSKALQDSSRVGLNAILTPFQHSIESFRKEVQDIHHRETTQQGALKKELDSLKELNRQITEEAHQLSTALRGQKKLQGNWGELVLENILDRSGLELGKDYRREVSVMTESGRQRPDAIVFLPQGKHLIIDAKVSLEAYTRFVNSEDEGERATQLKAHIQAVGDRIDELAERDYFKIPGMNSPEMVFMFMPIESSFVEAFRADETLFQKAIEKHVLVATPTTLLTSLNIVRQLWRYEDQNKHTALLAEKAEQVFNKLNGFLSTFQQIRQALDRASDSYQKAEKQLISGRGNLVKQVSDFKRLAPAIKAELPEHFTDPAHLEIDYLAALADDEEHSG